jgi:ubiquinone/menaquinone biosynthesis C-methylase UbiE
MTPSAKREVLVVLVQEHHVPVRRACQAMRLSRAAYYRPPRPRLHGIELLDDRVRTARERWPEFGIVQGNAAELPYRDRSFDVVLQSTVFTSLFDPGFQEEVAREMVRVLRREGWILWYDFRVNNPWNPDVREVPKRRVKAPFPGMASAFRTHYWAVLWWPDGTRA